MVCVCGEDRVVHLHINGTKFEKGQEIQIGTELVVGAMNCPPLLVRVQTIVAETHRTFN